jgi:hypothetical protein
MGLNRLTRLFWFGTGVFVLVLVYVDDFLMLSPSGVQLEEVYQAIASLYESAE